MWKTGPVCGKKVWKTGAAVEFATLLFGRKNDKIWHVILEEKIYAAKKRRKAFAGREL